MKRLFLVNCFLFIVFLQASAQLHVTEFGTSIRADTAAPHPSSILDVQSSSKGVLVPRMTGANKFAIALPAKGLLVFDTDRNCYSYYDGIQWVDIAKANSDLLTLEQAKLIKVEGDYLETTGYYINGDGGDGKYIKGTPTVPLLGFTDLSGQDWKLIDPIIKPEHAGSDGTVIKDTPAMLAIASDPRKKRINGAYKVNSDIDLAGNSIWEGTGSIELDNASITAGLVADARHIYFGAIKLSLINSSTNYAIKLGYLARRIHFDKTKILGSTGHGVWVNGAYIIDWDVPYIVNVAGRALCVEHNTTFDTGGNAINFNGGEIQNVGFGQSVWAIYLEKVKQITFDKTIIEGVYGGIETGKEVLGLNLEAKYFEGCKEGILKSKGTATDAQADRGGQVVGLNIPAGTVLFQRSSELTTIIELDDVIEWTWPSGSAIYAEANAAGDPIVKIGELAPNRARGGIGKQYLTAPNSFLQNNTRRFGFPKTRNFNLDKPLSATGTSERCYFDLTGLSYPARMYDLVLLVDTDSSGDAVFQVSGVRADGTYTETGSGGWRTLTRTVPAGMSKIVLFGALHDGGWPVVLPEYVRLRRVGGASADTAGEVKIISANITTYENNVD